jgi:hypothetical protein
VKKLSRNAPRVNAIIHTSRPFHSVNGEGRTMHPTERFRRHGRVQPMPEEPGFFARLFGRAR